MRDWSSHLEGGGKSGVKWETPDTVAAEPSYAVARNARKQEASNPAEALSDAMEQFKSQRAGQQAANAAQQKQNRDVDIRKSSQAKPNVPSTPKYDSGKASVTEAPSVEDREDVEPLS
jgi:hypothetical protein